MRTILALALLIASHAALAETRIVRDQMGREVGRSVSDRHGNTRFSDQMGRETGRAVTTPRGPVLFDRMGRRVGTVRP
jgi:hypothetical protein